MDMRALLNQAKKGSKKSTTLGHVSAARKILRALKKEVGAKEYKTTGPSAAARFVRLYMQEKYPNLLARVDKEVGAKRFTRECINLYYRVRDEE